MLLLVEWSPSTPCVGARRALRKRGKSWTGTGGSGRDQWLTATSAPPLWGLEAPAVLLHPPCWTPQWSPPLNTEGIPPSRAGGNYKRTGLRLMISGVIALLSEPEYGSSVTARGSGSWLPPVDEATAARIHLATSEDLLCASWNFFAAVRFPVDYRQQALRVLPGKETTPCSELTKELAEQGLQLPQANRPSRSRRQFLFCTLRHCWKV